MPDKKSKSKCNDATPPPVVSEPPNKIEEARKQAAEARAAAAALKQPVAEEPIRYLETKKKPWREDAEAQKSKNQAKAPWWESMSRRQAELFWQNARAAKAAAAKAAAAKAAAAKASEPPEAPKLPWQTDYNLDKRPFIDRQYAAHIRARDQNLLSEHEQNLLSALPLVLEDDDPGQDLLPEKMNQYLLGLLMAKAVVHLWHATASTGNSFADGVHAEMAGTDGQVEKLKELGEHVRSTYDALRYIGGPRVGLVERYWYWF